MTTALPHTLGQTLARARELLAEAGWAIVDIEEAGPPDKYRQPNGPLRVIQERQVEPGRIMLVVARQISLNNR